MASRERIKELLPVMQAYAEGKDIQYKTVYEVVWTDLSVGGELAFLQDIEYRVKPEKKVVECWLNVYPNNSVYGYSTKAMADGDASSTRIACLHIKQEYEEGEGL